MGRGADPCLSHGSLYTLRHIERAGWRVGLSIGYQADRQALLSTLHCDMLLAEAHRDLIAGRSGIGQQEQKKEKSKKQEKSLGF